MEIEMAKKCIGDQENRHKTYVENAELANRYYEGLHDRVMGSKETEQGISHGFYQILVDQLAAYLFTDPPTFDMKSTELNQKVLGALGLHYTKICKGLSIDASNHTNGWLHVWESKDKTFAYSILDGRYVMPIYARSLDRQLQAVIRSYETVNEAQESIMVYEYWTAKDCTRYWRPKEKTIESLKAYPADNNVVTHSWGRVPFIEFPNNQRKQNDLANVKRLIDTYNRVIHGYIQDVEEIQQIIFMLEGYGGTDLHEFLGELKQYKTVNAQGLSTLSVEIPTEARCKLVEILEKNIDRFGQGNLELKVGAKQTEFEIGFDQLIRLILKHLGEDPTVPIMQVWKRNSQGNRR